MQNNFVVKNANVSTILNIKGYLEMRLGWTSWLFKKIKCQLVDDAHTCVVFNVKTSKKKFERIQNELDELYPGLCVYFSKKETQPKG